MEKHTTVLGSRLGRSDAQDAQLANDAPDVQLAKAESEADGIQVCIAFARTRKLTRADFVLVE